MITKRIACASIFLGLSSLVGMATITPAALANPTQLTACSFTQQVGNRSKAQDDSTPKQGLPGRRVSGGTRNTQNFLK